MFPKKVKQQFFESLYTQSSMSSLENKREICMPRCEPLDHVNLRVGRILFLFHVIILMPFNSSVRIQ